MEVAYQFPDLQEYSDLWPIRDMIKSHLKYMSSAAKRRSKSTDDGEESDDGKSKKVSHVKGKGKARDDSGA